MQSFAIVTIDGEGTEPELFVSLLLANGRVFPYPCQLRLLSSAPVPKNHDARVRHTRISKLDYLGYSKFCVESLHEHVPEDYCLIVQPDGFIVDPSRWRDEYLKYDYIGAPWYSFPWRRIPRGAEVGNGGFSLRSRRFLEASAKLSWTSDWSHLDPPIVEDSWGNEDLFLCIVNREKLERWGIRFAPRRLARRFSVQAGDFHLPWRGVHTTFGFHGHELLPKVQTLLDQRGIHYEHLTRDAPPAGAAARKRIAVVELLGHHQGLETLARTLGPRDDIELDWVLGSSTRRRLRRRLTGSVHRVPQPMQEWWANLPPLERKVLAPAAALELWLGALLALRQLRKTRPALVHLHSGESPLFWPLLAWLARSGTGLSMVLHDPKRYAPNLRSEIRVPFLGSCAQRADLLLLLAPYLELPPHLSARPHAWLNPFPVRQRQHDCTGTRFVIDGQPEPCARLLDAFASLKRTNPSLLAQCDLFVLKQRRAMNLRHAEALGERVRYLVPGPAQLPNLVASACYALVAAEPPPGEHQRANDLVLLALAAGVPLLLPETHAPSWKAENVLRYRSSDPLVVLAGLIGKSHDRASQAAERMQAESLAEERRFVDLVLRGAS